MSVKPPAGNRLINDDTPDEAPQSLAMPETPSVRPSPTRTPKAAGGKGPYPGRRQVTAHIDRNLFMGLKAISVQTDKPMVEIFEEALQSYLQSTLSKKNFNS